MLKNYILIALRNIRKNRLYAVINILGLAIGLTIYLFGGILADYERSHDTMWANHDRTYTLGSLLKPEANIGVAMLDNTYTAMGPLIEAEMSDTVEAVARTVRERFLVSVEDKHFRETIRFADKDLLEIFDFQYLEGGPEALSDPSGMILSRSNALKYYGRTDVIGETVLLNHEHSLHVAAVITDVPQNSHFNSSILFNVDLGILAPLEALNRFTGWELEGNWNNLSTGNYVYVMTKGHVPIVELDAKINAVFDQHATDELKEKFMFGVDVRPLKATHTAVWDMIGMPVIDTIQVLGIFVLVIAIVNYTNLAAAQSMGRAQEVGMRKTLGANRGQLLGQFLIESLTIVAISMMLAIVLLEMIVPIFNGATEKILTLDHAALLPWLALTTVVVGLTAGAYPSYLITKVSPIDALKDAGASGAKGSWFRSLMIGFQFVLSIFILANVMIMYFQNEKVKDSSLIFPKDTVVALQNMSVETLRLREGALRDELVKLPDVERVTFATQIPFEQSNNRRTLYGVKGDENTEVEANVLYTDPDFLPVFNIPLLTGRNFDSAIVSDTRTDEDVRRANVVVNQMFARSIGYPSPVDAVGQMFWGGIPEEGPDVGKDAFQYTIIGVIEDQNMQGLHNEIKPWVFMNYHYEGLTHFYGAVRLSDGAGAGAVQAIENAWQKVNPDYPVDQRFLSDVFEDVYTIYRTMNTVFAGFAAIAMLLAVIGLFGLAAFMARGRTKEIGLRKVLGASVPQIIRLLIWQFSKPVMGAIVIALPMAYFASGLYLDFFADPFSLQVPVILSAGLITVLVAWVVIALHAGRVARANPIVALRYE